VLDAATETLLTSIVRRESRSLLQYVHDAFPWTTQEEQQALVQLRALIAEEQDGVAALTQALGSRGHVYPYFGSYPMAFTTINYVSLEHLLPLLVDYERRSLHDLERDLSGLRDAQAQELVAQLVDMKRRHLKVLQDLAAAHPETASTIR
jgi:hypothetical protein